MPHPLIEKGRELRGQLYWRYPTDCCDFDCTVRLVHCFERENFYRFVSLCGKSVRTTVGMGPWGARQIRPLLDAIEEGLVHLCPRCKYLEDQIRG